MADQDITLILELFVFLFQGVELFPEFQVAPDELGVIIAGGTGGDGQAKRC